MGVLVVVAVAASACGGDGGATRIHPVFSRVPTSDPVVFFTIDDGLVRDPAVIDDLRAENLPVTVFPVPAYVHQDPGYFQAIQALGASIQDHTRSHPDLRRLGAGAQQGEICGRSTSMPMSSAHGRGCSVPRTARCRFHSRPLLVRAGSVRSSCGARPSTTGCCGHRVGRSRPATSS
jgi:hypothetical protein